jgi:hypothetical protein
MIRFTLILVFSGDASRDIERDLFTDGWHLVALDATISEIKKEYST